MSLIAMEKDELARRMYCINNFECEKVIFCDIPMEPSQFKEAYLHEFDEKCSGFVCMLDRNTPQVSILSYKEMLRYFLDNATAYGKLGNDNRNGLCLRNGQSRLPNINILIRLQDTSQLNNLSRIIFLNQDENGNIIESWLEDKQTINSRYASIPYVEFYNRTHL